MVINFFFIDTYVYSQVWEVPTGAEVLAFSDKTGVEMFTIGDHILGIQGHPEYSKDILKNLIDRLLNQDSIEVFSPSHACSSNPPCLII